MMLTAIVMHTPTWVWLLFLYLLYVGFLGLHDQPINIRKAGILTIAFFIFSFVKTQGDPSSIAVWLIGLIIGFGAGYYLFSTQIKKAYRGADQLIYVPGKKNLLILLVTVFLLHYIFTVLLHIQPSPMWNTANMFINGFTTGILIYRTREILKQYKLRRPV